MCVVLSHEDKQDVPMSYTLGRSHVSNVLCADLCVSASGDDVHVVPRRGLGRRTHLGVMMSCQSNNEYEMDCLGGNEENTLSFVVVRRGQRSARVYFSFQYV